MSYKSDKRITTIPQLIKLAQNRKSVIDRNSGKITPAAWMVNYPAIILYARVKLGKLYIYKPKKI